MNISSEASYAAAYLIVDNKLAFELLSYLKTYKCSCSTKICSAGADLNQTL